MSVLWRGLTSKHLNIASYTLYLLYLCSCLCCLIFDVEIIIIIKRDHKNKAQPSTEMALSTRRPVYVVFEVPNFSSSSQYGITTGPALHLYFSSVQLPRVVTECSQSTVSLCPSPDSSSFICSFYLYMTSVQTCIMMFLISLFTVTKILFYILLQTPWLYELCCQLFAVLRYFEHSMQPI